MSQEKKLIRQKNEGGLIANTEYKIKHLHLQQYVVHFDEMDQPRGQNVGLEVNPNAGTGSGSFLYLWDKDEFFCKWCLHHWVAI